MQSSPRVWSGNDVADWSIAWQDNRYVLQCQGIPVTTPAGHTVAHQRRDIIHAMWSEAWMCGELDVTNGQYYSLYATQHDLLDRGFAAFVAHVPHLLASHESTTQLSPGPEQVDQRWAWRSVAAWLNEHGCALPIGPHAIDASLVAAVTAALWALHPAQQSAVMTLFHRHEMSLLLALMVVLGRCTADEYVVGALIHTPVYPPNGLDPDANVAFADVATQWAREVQVACDYCTIMMRS